MIIFTGLLIPLAESPIICLSSGMPLLKYLGNSLCRQEEERRRREEEMRRQQEEMMRRQQEGFKGTFPDAVHLLCACAVPGQS